MEATKLYTSLPLQHSPFRWPAGRIGLIPVFVGASGFGGLIELIQPSFGRSADMQDWIADIAGVALGIMLALLYRKHRA